MSISTCTVSGNVKNLLGQNVSDCTVKVSIITPFFHSGSFISGELESVITNDSGDFSITLVETETLGKKVTFALEYYDGVSARRQKKYTVIVPNTPTADFSDMVTAEDVNPNVLTTFPAANVTVTAITGLSATRVQDALAEHQVEIDDVTATAAGAASGLADHLADTTDAHDASAISVVASGNLAATDAQTALTELQTDIDTRAIGVASSVDSEVALFSSTGGKQLKRATGTGFAKLTSGVLSTSASVSLSSDVTGNLPVANLNGGTGATSSTFWRGDGTWAAASAAPSTPTIQTFTSGSGTYTTPAGVAWIKVTVQGGGGGGSGSGTAGTVSGGAGGNTTFGSSLITCNGGAGGVRDNATTGAGGSATITTSASVLQLAAISGGDGAGSDFNSSSGARLRGGAGGASPFGGNGQGSLYDTAGRAAKANTGSGGSGGGCSGTASSYTGAGGGAGGYAVAVIKSPSSSYAYAVGAAGTAGSAGTSGFAGAAGAAGVIIVEEYYV